MNPALRAQAQTQAQAQTGADALSGGFADPSVQSARAFRAALQAMSRPGSLVTMQGASPPAPLSVAAGVLMLTLADATTPVHLAGGLDCPLLRDWVTFHCGAPLVAAQDATLALGTWPDLQPVTRFSIGTAAYPDRAATLIVEVPQLLAQGVVLTGPGIRDRAALNLPDPVVFSANHALFPLGFDTFLTCEDRLAGLPRSTKIGGL